ncbi:unnamed protein product [Heterobilharzia americana]|nr:unnamed protein product [Heterobilharzia americana]
MLKNTEQSYQLQWNKLFQQLIHRINLSKWPLLCECISEFLGTTLYMIIGLGVIIQTSIGQLNNQHISQLMSTSIGWGIAELTGLLISTIGRKQLGYINPSLIFAYCFIGKLSFRYLLPFTLFQLIGSILGTFIIISVYYENIHMYKLSMKSYEKLQNNFTGSLLITSPGVSHHTCLITHILSFAIFTGIILVINNNNNNNNNNNDNYYLPKELQPMYIGILVSGIIASLCLNIDSGLNPIRDLGARIAISLYGWDIQAFQANNYYFWIPVIGPYLGAVIGSLFYEFTVGLCLPLSILDHHQHEHHLDDGDIINSTEDCFQSSLAEEMNEDLFDMTEIEDYFTDVDDSL